MFPSNWLAAAAAVPNILLSICFQINFFPIFKGMKDANDSKMTKASGFGIAFCVVVYIIVGILGYLYVGPHVSANFLESLPYDKIAHGFFFLINLSFLISIFFAFPIMFFSCRNNFIAIVKLIVSPPEPSSKPWRTGD